MVLRLLHRGLLIGGALFAGLVTSAAAQQQHVPVTFGASGYGLSACSGPLFGQQFDSLAAAIAAAEAVTGRPYCHESWAPYYCGERVVQDPERDWTWRRTSTQWEYWIRFRTWREATCEGQRGDVVFMVWRPLSCDPDPDLCEPPVCAQFAGYEIGMFYEGEQTYSQVCASPPPEEIRECAATVVGAPFCNGGLCYGTLRFTGDLCSNEPPIGDIEAQTIVPPPNNNCITSGTLSVCFSKSDKNCGLVNGEPWCASEMPSNGCVSTESGAVVCTVDAWSAPTQPDGETPAEPDGVFTVGAENGGQVYEYFRRETVASL